MAALLNRARMSTATTGTGTITLGSAVTGYASFAEAGAVNATVYSYCIEDGDDFEIGVGTYTSSGTTFSRGTVTLSKISGTAGTSKINLSGSAQIFITGRVADLGDVFGPASVTDGHSVLFDGATGKLLKTSGAAPTSVTEGTFTPSISFGTPGDLSVSYSRQLGAYTRIGNRAWVDIDLNFTPTFTTASGNFVINGLPFTAETIGTGNPGFSGNISGYANINFGATDIALVARVNSAATTASLIFCRDNTTGAQVVATTNITSGVACSFLIGASYVVDT